MTVSKNTPVNNYTGNGSTTTFDFDFLINAASELVVEKTKSDGEQVTLTLDTDYSIHEIGDEDGSYITFPITGSSHSVLGSDEKITLSLCLDIEQDKEYKNSNKLNLEVLEGSLDYLTRIAQIQNRQIERSVKIAEGAVVTTQELGRNVNVIADNIDAINAVNAIKSNVTTVANNTTNINTLASINSDITTTANVASNISSVSDITDDITTLADITDEIGTVSNIYQGVILCAANTDNITAVAENMEDIQTACESLVYYGEDEPSANYKLWIDPSGDTDPHFTSTLKSKIDGIAAGAQVNVIEDVKVNGVSLTISSKAVDVTVPTNTNQLTNGAGFLTSSDITGKQDVIDSSHKLSADLVDDTSTTNKFVTASDKTAWNGKSTVSGTNDGTNWSTITIDGTTKNIPSSSGGSIDVQINSTSIVVSDVANIVTETAYDASTNKIATVADLPDISGKQDKAQAITTLSGTSITLTDNSINTLTPTGNTTFTLPTISDTTKYHQILVQLDLSTVYTITLGTTTYFEGSAPDLSATGNYNLIYEYDNALSAWVVGCVEKGAAS